MTNVKCRLQFQCVLLFDTFSNRHISANNYSIPKELSMTTDADNEASI